MNQGESAAVTSSKGPYRPRAGFRIGVAGERDLGEVARAPLQEAVKEAFRHIVELIEATLATGDARKVYNGEPPVVHCLSTLDGASDAIQVQAALDAGCRLHAVLPWHQETWRKLSAATHPGLVDLIAAAEGRVVQLDGGTDDAPGLPWPAADMARDAAIRMVVRNSDLLIVIWTGQAGSTAGDVASAVHLARANGVPVLWLTPTDPTGKKFLPDRDTVPAATREFIAGSDRPYADLDEHIAKVLQPAYAAVAPSENKWLRRLRGAFHWLTGDLRRYEDRVACYLAEPEPRNGWLGRRFNSQFIALRNGIAGAVEFECLKERVSAMTWTRPATSLWYRGLFRHPDELASFLGERYRCTFLDVFILGAIAATLVLASTLFHSIKPELLCVELILLLTIAILVRWERKNVYQRRWLDYRLLAEVLRLQEFLSPVGRVLPLRRALDNDAPRKEREREWVGWYFNALLRECRLEYGFLDQRRLERIRDDVQHFLLTSDDAQIRYFERNAWRYHRTGRVLEVAAVVAFFATFVPVVVKLMGWPNADWTLFWTMVAGCLPPLATAMFALRSHGEFEVLAQNGKRTSPQLRRAAKRLARLEFTTALSSEALGDEVAATTGIIVADIQGWSLLFNVKAVELA